MATRKTAATKTSTSKTEAPGAKSTGKRAALRSTRASPGKRPDFGNTYARLRKLLKPYDRKLDVRRDDPGGYEAWCTGEWKGREMFFAGVREGKSYVSFYFFPVYTQPRLLDTMPDDLKKRMQGKSCFNFRAIDPAVEKSMRALVKRGFELYQRQNLV